MQVSLETIEGLKRRLTVTVPAEKVQVAYNNEVNKISKTARIDGFRPGKVPKAYIEKRYADNILYEITDVLIRESLDQAIKEKELRVAGYPKIDLAEDKPGIGKPMTYTAELEVFPDIKLAGLTGVTLAKQIASVTDEDVANTVEKLRRQHAQFNESDAAARDGDRVTIDFEGKIKGEVFEGGSGNDMKVVIGSKSMISGFETGLIGLKKDDQKTLSLVFPENYHQKDYAGQAVEFAVTVKSVDAAVLPELDAEFLKKFNADNVDKLKEEIKQNLSRNCEQLIKNKLRDGLIEKLLEINTFDIPSSLVEGEINRLKQQSIQQMGVKDPQQQKQFLQYLPNDMFEQQAKKNVKIGLLFDAMVQERALKADPAKTRRYIENLAASYEQPEQAVSWYYSQKNILDEIEHAVLEEMLIDAILESITVNEEAVNYEELTKPQS